MQFSEYDDILALCREQVPEGLRLEYKEKNNPDRPELDSADKRAIAKAVSAFANSGGGTLIFGIRSFKGGDWDVAEKVIAIDNPRICQAQVDFVCQNNVNPEVLDVKSKIMLATDGRGVVVCHVPPSERRPHMSTAPGVHTYYRRTFQGDVQMTPFEVVEQVLAVREAVLKPTLHLSTGSIASSVSGWITLGYGFAFTLENIGSRACLNPFLRVRSSQPAQSHGALLDARLDMWKNELPYGTIVHVGDSRSFFSLQFIARVFPEKFWSIGNGDVEGMIDAIRIYGGTDDFHSSTVTDKLEVNEIRFDVNFGAENSVSRTQSFLFERREISARLLIANEDHIRERAMSQAGGWRSNLIAKLKLEYP